MYERWIAHIETSGYPEHKRLLLLPYDWRVDIRTHATELDQKLDTGLAKNDNRRAMTEDAMAPTYQPQPTDNAIVVDHSQGRLIMHQHVRDPLRTAKVDTMRMLGTRNLGTIRTLDATCTTGYNCSAPWLDPEMGKDLGNNGPAAYLQNPVKADGVIDSVLIDASGNPVSDVASEAARPTYVFCDALLQNTPACRESSMYAGQAFPRIGGGDRWDGGVGKARAACRRNSAPTAAGWGSSIWASTAAASVDGNTCTARPGEKRSSNSHRRDVRTSRGCP